MGHEKRIAAAFEDNSIQRVLVIDDVYDMPALDGITGDILDYFGDIAGQDACREAGVNDLVMQAAQMAIDGGDADSDDLHIVMQALYAKFVETRSGRFDPGGRFKLLKELTLEILDPLVSLLAKCGAAVEIVKAGLTNGEECFVKLKPQVIFLDFFLSADAAGASVTAAVKQKARKASIDLLNRLLKTKPEDDPAIVLMSSEEVKDKAQRFRQDVEQLGESVLAIRFRFIQKGWVRKVGDDLKIENEAADALLDTSQGFVFGQVLHRALKEWKGGAEVALKGLLKEIATLEPKDLAYLFRFRLASDGEKMGDYLEWLFGENLRAKVAESVNWSSDALTRLDDPALSEGIEGAFDGPSVPIAKFFQRIRFEEHREAAGARRRLGDLFIRKAKNKVMVVITPDCDLVDRTGGPKAVRLLTMDGELRSFDEDSASADQFIFHKKRPYSIKWNPKALNTFPVIGPGSLSETGGVEFLGTLRPLYAQEVQRLALTDLGRIGVSVAPTMGVDASVTVHLRRRANGANTFEVIAVSDAAVATVLLERDTAKGHRVLLRRSYVHALVDKLRVVDVATLHPDDAIKLAEFLREKNETLLVNGFLIKGAATKGKGPLSTTITIAANPDAGKDGAWMQFTLKLSDESMDELLSVDPSLVPAEEEPALIGAA